jgi:tetraprenyl-beta-curcumene synthase
LRPRAGHPLKLSVAFLSAAWCYWLNVFPQLRRELRRWRARAASIPDAELRRLALDTYRLKWSNIEGAAAFATLAPSAHRHTAIKALITFQAAYDYADTLAEQPAIDPVANGYSLHRPLIVALGEDVEHPDYYAHSRLRRDGGYLKALTDSCRRAVDQLPSYQLVQKAARRAAERIAAYQSLNHRPNAPQAGLAIWAGRETPAGSGLRWWETAAACASSLTALALLSAAADPHLTTVQTVAIETAYHPWIGALHTLLDSLIDWEEDELAGQPSLLDNYPSMTELTARMRMLATRSRTATSKLAHDERHFTILAGMVGVYLSAPEAHTPRTAHIAAAVLDEIAHLARPSLLVIKTRRAAIRRNAIR